LTKEPSLDAIYDPRRLAALERANLLDTPPEAPFDRLTRLAAKLVQTPLALVSLVDANRQFFKSSVGLPEPVLCERETPLSHSFCKYVVATGEPLIVDDAREHAYLSQNPAVASLGVIAYLGVPLQTMEGHVLGSFCVIDSKPRRWSEDEIEILRELSASVMTEITLRERLQAEAAQHQVTRVDLQDQESFVSAVLDSLQEGIVACDADGRLAVLNRATQQFHGLSADPLGSAEWAAHEDLYAADGATPLTEAEMPLRRAFRGEILREVEMVIAPKGAMRRRVYCTGQPVRNAEGRQIGAVVAMRDVTEREAAALALRESMDLYRTTVDEAPVGMAHSALDGHWLQVNPRLCQMMGYSAEELLARRFQDITHPDDVAGDLALEEQLLLRLAPTLTREKRYLHKNGKQVCVSISLTLLRDQNGAPQRYIHIIQDITEQKSLEEQLRQSQKMDAIGRLAGGIAHDFNNMLSVISGYSEILMLRSDLHSKAQAQVGEIHQAATRAAGLTRQLLAFSRKEVIAPKVLALHEVVRDLSSMLRRVIGEDIKLVTHHDPVELLVNADPSHIEQILLNLAVNARDAMPQGGSLVMEVRAMELDGGGGSHSLELEPGSYVLLTVSDTGCGMDSATRARIFEPFFTTKAVGEGTGLGLATVYGVVKQSGGAISVDSEPGQGTTFNVYLPRVRATQGTSEQTASGSRQEGSGVILLVEDEEMCDASRSSSWKWAATRSFRRRTGKRRCGSARSIAAPSIY